MNQKVANLARRASPLLYASAPLGLLCLAVGQSSSLKSTHLFHFAAVSSCAHLTLRLARQTPQRLRAHGAARERLR